MRRMSFALTTEAIVVRRKTVTRRPAHTWRTLKVGDRIVAVDKCMGLKPGQQARVLGVLRIVDVRVERLTDITQGECALEGFPEKSPEQFVMMIAGHYCLRAAEVVAMYVRRIEFEYLTGPALIAALGEVDTRAKAGRKARERKAAR